MKLTQIYTNYFTSCPVVMNQFVVKLDSRYDKTKKPGAVSTVKRERVSGLSSTSSPPTSIPSWMVDPGYKASPSIAAVCMRESSLEPMQEHSVVDGKGWPCVCVKL